jgi:AhpD family alkylhydroperoxidase
MSARINYQNASPTAVKAMLQLQAAVNHSGLEQSLIHLVKIRASQINHCAYCIDMHTKEARASGETEERLYLLDAWRETSYYTDRERAALLWTETLTLLPEKGAPDEVFEQVREEFDETELVNLTLAIVSINGWNRFGVGFHMDPGSTEDAATAAKVAQAPR